MHMHVVIKISLLLLNSTKDINCIFNCFQLKFQSTTPEPLKPLKPLEPEVPLEPAVQLEPLELSELLEPVEQLQPLERPESLQPLEPPEPLETIFTIFTNLFHIS